MNRKLVAAIILVVLVLGGVLLTRALKQSKLAAQQTAEEEPALPVETQPVKIGDIYRSFTATGTVEAKVDVSVVSKIPGKVAKVYVDEGDAVKAGQLLAVLEHRDLLSQLNQARAAVAAAEARLKQAQTGVGLQAAQTSTGIASAEAQLQAAEARLQQAQTNAQITTTQTVTSVQQAQEALKQAQARLDIIKQGARLQQKQQAEEAVHRAQANRDTAKKNLDRAQQLLAEGAIAQQQYDAAKLQYDVATANYNAAVQELDLIREGARSEEIRIAEAQVQQATAALALARANQAQNDIRQRDVEAAQNQVDQARAGLEMAQAAAARNQISEEDVQAARAGLAQAKANVGYLQTQIGYAYIRAPAPGIVAQRNIDAGESALPGVPLFRLVNNAQVYVRAQIGEVKIGEIDEGQVVKVTVDALGGVAFRGTVSEILPIAEPASRAVEVKIRVPNAEGKLKQGMFARIEIIAEQQTNVLVVPREAVIERDGKSFVYIAERGQAIEKEVQTGLQEADSVAILRGLNQGDQVIVRGQDRLESGQRIEIRRTGVTAEQ